VEGKKIDDRELGDAPLVQLPERDPPVIGGPLPAVDDAELLFVDPVEVPVEDVPPPSKVSCFSAPLSRSRTTRFSFRTNPIFFPSWENFTLSCSSLLSVSCFSVFRSLSQR